MIATQVQLHHGIHGRLNHETMETQSALYYKNHSIQISCRNQSRLSNVIGGFIIP